MTDRAVVIGGFAVIGIATVVAIVVSHVRPDRVATISATLDHLTRTRAAKLAAVLVWVWLGWHFLAR